LKDDFEMEDMTLAEWEQKEEILSKRIAFKGSFIRSHVIVLFFLPGHFFREQPVKSWWKRWATKTCMHLTTKNTSAWSRPEKIFHKQG